MGRPLSIPGSNGHFFHMPNIQSLRYDVGKQVFSPGETCKPIPQHFDPVAWPNVVPSLSVLANFEGLPRERGTQIVNNATAELPSNYLFIGGLVGKS